MPAPGRKGEIRNDLSILTSAPPFEAEVFYSRFAAYALLNHRGDFPGLGRAGMAGYGVEPPGGGAGMVPQLIKIMGKWR